MKNHTSRKKTVTFNFTEAGDGQAFLVASVQDNTAAPEAAGDAYAQIGDILKEKGMQIVQERTFGSLSVEHQVRSARTSAFQERDLPTDTPFTYIEGHPPWGEGFSGLIVRAVAVSKQGDEIWTIKDEGQPCGRGWRRNGLTFIVLQNIQGIEKGPARINTPAMQVQRVIERAEQILQVQGLSYSDVVRTWFYLADILKWYDEFNEVRNTRYKDFGLMPATNTDPLLLPASTGIQGITPQRSSCAMDLIAVSTNDDIRTTVVQMTNQKQRDAFYYGSSFSRGAFIKEPDVSLIEVSGTAAIGATGMSLYQGDIKGQVKCTFDIIENLISQRGARLEDICAGTVFLKHPEYFAPFSTIAEERGLDTRSCVTVVADVCREDLLFELDAEVAFDQSQSHKVIKAQSNKGTK